MAVEASILRTIKGLLGPDDNYDVFDQDIIVFINSALSTLTQVGIGPTEGFRITGPKETWDDLIEGAENIESVKEYIYMKVKMAFDPPTSSFVMSAYQDTCNELLWRLNVAVDPGNYN